MEAGTRALSAQSASRSTPENLCSLQLSKLLTSVFYALKPGRALLESSKFPLLEHPERPLLEGVFQILGDYCYSTTWLFIQQREHGGEGEPACYMGSGDGLLC